MLVKLNRDHVCSVTPLTNTPHDTTVTKMELHGSGSDATVYIGMVDGLYMEPVVDCGERYGSNCAACVGARDPYCAFDFDEGRCSAVPADDGLADIPVGTERLKCICQRSLSDLQWQHRFTNK